MNLYKTDCTNSLNLYKMDDQQEYYLTDKNKVLEHMKLWKELEVGEPPCDCRFEELETICEHCDIDIVLQIKVYSKTFGKKATWETAQKIWFHGDFWRVAVVGEQCEIEEFLLDHGIVPEVFGEWNRRHKQVVYKTDFLCGCIDHKDMKKLIRRSGGGRATKPAKR